MKDTADQKGYENSTVAAYYWPCIIPQICFNKRIFQKIKQVLDLQKAASEVFW